MKFCYVDESGTGDEPFMIMVGIIVDAARMHKTKADWEDLLRFLSRTYRRRITELHARHFYRGLRRWRTVRGELRFRIISVVLQWLVDRKHHITFSGLARDLFSRNRKSDLRLERFHSEWCFVGLHLILTIQKQFQKYRGIKGNTVFIFDESLREKTHFAELIGEPPDWTDEYYARDPKKPRLDQVIDAPYYANSEDVHLIQVADLLAFLIKKYVEIKEGYYSPSYPDEEKRLSLWLETIVELSLPVSTRFPAARRDKCSDLFHEYAPESLRKLGR